MKSLSSAVAAKLREDAWQNMSKPEGVSPQVWRRVQNGRASKAEYSKVMSKASGDLAPLALRARAPAGRTAQAFNAPARIQPEKPIGISPQSWRAYQKGKASAALSRKIESRMG